jgi:hypothetical protein
MGRASPVLAALPKSDACQLCDGDGPSGLRHAFLLSCQKCRVICMAKRSGITMSVLCAINQWFPVTRSAWATENVDVTDPNHHRS